MHIVYYQQSCMYFKVWNIVCLVEIAETQH